MVYSEDLKSSAVTACGFESRPGHQFIFGGFESRHLHQNYFGPVAQRIEQQPSKLWVTGSNPVGVAKLETWLSGRKHLTANEATVIGP